ncbi:hypothetical protein GF339_20480 [candidate division KSB3 bacterium]|uniref:L-fucose isomerase C-terminal domain-containing protein n=1 Tax=candidate division KSB3 bacterium TaxID=2044937 RepID=A0A9D5JZA2_9BACT|nr:hypothetical protein [candidate division KSB3 bacterium]MBD3326974.1 hypothetical protein [candidate division KSB3 bacterium]
MPTQRLTPYVGVAAVSSPLEVGADRAPQVARDLGQILEEAGCRVLPLGAIGTPDEASTAGRQATEAHVDALVFAPVSWFEDYLILQCLEECPVPSLFWPLPGMETGALCGAQQITCYLKQLDHPYAAVFGELEDHQCIEQAQQFLRAAVLKQRLRRARIGFAGHRVPGMTETAPNEFMLKKALGPILMPLDLPILLEQSAQMPDDDAVARWEDVVSRAGSCQVTEDDGIDAMKVYAALYAMIQEYGLDAVTVGCYPHLMGKVCMSIGLLADQGIPFACEGDVNGAVAQLMLALLTDSPTHSTDWLDPLPDETVVFSHCGSGSFMLAEQQADIQLTPVRLMDRGVCAIFPAKPGPVTLLNLMATPEGYQCALVEGEAVRTEMVFPGNPVRVQFAQPLSTVMQWIFDEGIGHHWMIGYGHVGAELRAWSRIVGRDVRLIEPA